MNKINQMSHQNIEQNYNLFQTALEKQMEPQQTCYNDFTIFLPKPTVDLGKVFNQLKLFSKQRLDTNDQNQQGIENQGEIKGLKFISTKLAKLFFKNRKLPYNQISKILIDNFASQQKDQRNIKRRVYDAINVLVAAGILVKKNNTIEMIKNKIKPKVQTDKKFKIEEQIAHKQSIIENKHKHYQNLLQKHKLIKKLFNRNIKLSTGKQKPANLKESSLKSSLRKRSRTETQINSGNKELTQLLSQNLQVIHEPHLFIITSTECLTNNKAKNKIIKKFSTHDQIELFVPKKEEQTKKQQCIQQIMGFIDQNENWRWQDRSILMEQQEPQKEEKINNQISSLNFQLLNEKSIFSLLELLSLLSLDELKAE